MTGRIIDCNGKTYELPILLEWDLRHTLGSPCDSFEVVFTFKNDMLEPLRRAVRFTAFHLDQVVFTGVVDEVEVTAQGNGLEARLSGRGLAALLMDNEAEPADYYGADLEFILSRHVRPWGITRITAESNPTVGEFSVSSGMSQWKVLCEFCSMCMGITPRFSAVGELVLTDRPGKTLELDGSCALISQTYRQDRYGVISEVLVKAGARGGRQVVENADFKALGGSSRRIINVPRKTGASAMRYTGEYQIQRSEEDFQTCELKIPGLFAAMAGDIVMLSNAPISLSGKYIAAESRCIGNADGAYTVLKLRKWDE